MFFGGEKAPAGMMFREEAKKRKKYFFGGKKAPAGMMFREEAFLQKN